MLHQRALKIHSLSEKLKAAVGLRRRTFSPPVVVGIAGGAYSGKKTFCRGLRSLLDADGAVFLPEALYRRQRELIRDPEGFLLDVPVDDPGAFDSALLAHHLEGLLGGSPVLVPHFDWERGCRGSTWQALTPAPVIVVEGEFLFEDPSVLERLDFKVFIDTPLDARVERLIAMELAEKNLPQGWGSQEVRERLLPIHELYVEARRHMADAVISGEMPFESSLMELGARILDEVFLRRRK